jgi:hypothetical protein
MVGIISFFLLGDNIVTVVFILLGFLPGFALFEEGWSVALGACTPLKAPREDIIFLLF